MKIITPSMSLFLLVAMSFLGAGTQSVHAASDPCEGDSAKYCSVNRPDDPARLYCLKTVESQISPACKAYLKNINGSADDFIDECYSDYLKVCEKIRPGQGRILECLRDHSKDLDFECRKQVNMLPRHNPKN